MGTWQQEHKQQVYAQQKEYRKTKAGKEALAKANKKFLLKWKNLVFDHYGRICKCCGEFHEEFLTMDHVNNDGAKHRKEIGKETIILYKWLVAHNFPKEFQPLCWNCNTSKGFFGYCPHKIC